MVISRGVTQRCDIFPYMAKKGAVAIFFNILVSVYGKLHHEMSETHGPRFLARFL